MVADKAFAQRLDKALTYGGIPNDRNRRKTVAKMFDVSVEAARKWLAGESTPKTKRIMEMADRLQVSGEWLLTGTGRMERNGCSAEAASPVSINDAKATQYSDEEREWIEIFRKLTEDQRTILRQIAGQFAIPHEDRRQTEPPDGKQNTRKTYYSPLMSELSSPHPVTKSRFSRWNPDEEKKKSGSIKTEKKS